MNNRFIDIEKLSEYFTSFRKEERATALFLKGLMIIVLTKIVRLWVASDFFFASYKPDHPYSIIGKVLLFPAILAENNMQIFLGFATVFLVIALILKPDYRINIVFFWLVLNVFKIKYPVINGADFVILTMSFLAIPLAGKPGFRNPYVSFSSVAVYNTFRILVQIQVIAIYLISGWDKLKTDIWRSGEAFDYIAHIDSMFNPFFLWLLENKSMQFVLSWITILFELSFIILVNIKRTRLAILCVGIFFHLGIWLMLGLPDFGWTMIATYLIFLKDEDLTFGRSPATSQLP